MGAIIYLLILALLKDYGHGEPQEGIAVYVFLGLLTSGATQQCLDIDECNTDGVCGKRGICQNLIGSYWCECPAGFTNFGKNQNKCVELNCDQYETQPGQTLPGFDSFLSLLRNNCLVLNNSTLSGPTRPLPTGDVLLTLLVNTTDVLQLDLQSNGHRSSSEVTKLLKTIGNLDQTDRSTADRERDQDRDQPHRR
ncbi:fibrillin-1 isoform X2 [Salmo salar]|uniref:Fibrillin-1 isoform X2 n=1 Tax=Salmo salar TaxID=8030 RepID=A0ABM3EEN4_SALSA|nr:fibrillin-1 isoform X2 [Salmo salar]